jgi:peptidyl-prolyl cis-trans isomerase C
MFVPSKRRVPTRVVQAGQLALLGDGDRRHFNLNKRHGRTARIKEDFLVSISPVLRPAAPIATRAAAAAVLFAALLVTTGPSIAQTPNLDPVIAVVNGAQIRESDVRLADEEIGRNLPTQDQIQRREEVIAMLIDTIILSTEATKQKIGDEADLQRRMAYARNQGLMNQLLVATAQRAASDEAVRKTYDDVVEKSPEIELHLRQIIFRADPKDEAANKAAEDKAKIAAQRIANGEDFAKVATEMSDDPVAKVNGGDFGWRGRSELGKEYVDAASKLKTGEVAPLFKTAFGLHIVKLEEQRTRKPLEFDQIRERVKAMVMRNAQMEIVSKLRSEAKIERKDQPVQAEKQKDSKN